ncbi:RcpC/CpaB family pilus assembly protein [Streptomyces sp. NPDC001691]|uniref:RcpC/CpaB family pilus assembly protein n=1 Tax=unclassified Streptomyces TaxID=2593676 RepID=UPI00294FFC3E|nr:RcpC/CpaB family pilus assembly protein [Streptomyces sp. SDr-06]
MPAPEPGAVPVFPPLRVRGGKHGLRRTLRKRRRAMAAGLAVTAAALAVSSPQAAERPHPVAAPAPRERGPARPPAVVSAPVRIADAETVRLLRPGDRVDVIASPNSPSAHGDEARVVATDARVTRVPGAQGGSAESGALVVLAVPRETARALAGAGTTSRLAVTLC